ncbi:hypothetical protein [Pseudomonas chlororaphis]|uniref:hypothetical protein n=1 Tax=Pseudomonas chlororaphis TaxID=587753 RepID=UPI002365EF16|nr:hypothetical protein [Pseudomonas chlororaphis]WDH22459.1 hypothetical protein PUP50_31620 [Pseudomonas chlororaphis]
MNVTFEAKLHYPPGAMPPDEFDPLQGILPAPDFVVSRDLNGDIQSYFRDMIWDFSAYNPEGKIEKLYFSFWSDDILNPSQLALVEQAKVVVFNLIWRRSGRPLSTGTLRNYLSVLNALCSYAYIEALQLRDVLGDESRLRDFCVTRCSGWMRETLSSLLPNVTPISAVGLGYEIVGEEFIRNLKKGNREYRAGLQQHPPMPTRIYSKFISGLISDFNEWRSVEEDILDVVKYCSLDPRAGRVIERQAHISRKLGLGMRFFKTVGEYISPKARAYLLSKGYSVSVSGLSAAVGNVQYVCKLLIQTFSGMRDDEVNTLPYHCIGSRRDRGHWHYFIDGRTTKFVGGRAKRARWVTNLEGHEAANGAQRIANLIYAHHDIRPMRAEGRINDHPLFVSVIYLGLGLSREPKDERFAVGVMTHRELPSECLSVITEDDLQELEHIDPHRAWRTEERFLAGKTWQFTSHQTRRSLALYAQRSGLVSLPSLRRQLKHITEEMSRYYARGSSFAKDFIGEHKDHFGLEWQATQPESSALSYIMNVILTDEKLFGGHGVWIQQQSKSGRLLGFDRDETIRRFNKGEMAYRESILGGCVSLEKCERVAIRWLHTPCITDNCKNLVGKVVQLDRVIEAQTNLIKLVDLNSAEYRTESVALDALVSARKKINS